MFIEIQDRKKTERIVEWSQRERRGKDKLRQRICILRDTGQEIQRENCRVVTGGWDLIFGQFMREILFFALFLACLAP